MNKQITIQNPEGHYKRGVKIMKSINKMNETRVEFQKIRYDNLLSENKNPQILTMIKAH